MDILLKNLILVRTVCEVRYNQSLLFEDIHTLNNIQKLARNSGLPQSQKNPDGTLTCFDGESSLALVVGPQSTFIAYEHPDDLSSFYSKPAKFLPDVLRFLEVDNLDRVGVRIQWMAKFPDEDQAKSLLIPKMYSEEIRKNFPSMHNTGVNFTVSNYDPVHMNIGLRTETHRIVSIHNGVANKNEINSGIVIDLDGYDATSKFRPEQINAFVKGLDGKFEQMLDSVLKLLR